MLGVSGEPRRHRRHRPGHRPRRPALAPKRRRHGQGSRQKPGSLGTFFFPFHGWAMTQRRLSLRAQSYWRDFSWSSSCCWCWFCFRNNLLVIILSYLHLYLNPYLARSPKTSVRGGDSAGAGRRCVRGADHDLRRPAPPGRFAWKASCQPLGGG